MLRTFYKNTVLLVTLLLVNSSLAADECCDFVKCNRFYIGAFGGEAYSNSPKIMQTGTAFFTEAQGGPLAVDARGHSKKKSSGFGGAQIGYEWAECPYNLGFSDWSLTPAVEVEAFFYRHTRKGELFNPTERLDEHDFLVSLPSNVGVYLFNGIISLNSCSLGRFTPYIGGGIGAADISIHKARSIQIDPPEVGVNHFNSKRHDSSWAFAAQAKTGLRYKLSERFHIFAEYRFLYLDTSNFQFGSTVYPGHAPTTTWDVEIKDLYYNAFAIGIQFDL